MSSDLAAAWQVHLRSQLYVLAALAPQALAGVSASKGRSVGGVFAHIHAIRLTWLEVAAPNLLEGMPRLRKEDAASIETLQGALTASGGAVEQLIEQAQQSGGRVKGFKRGIALFFAYLVAHESYHMGEIGIILNQSGHKLDDKVAYGMWEWDKL